MLFISCGDAYKGMVEEFDEKLRPVPKKETSIEDSNFVEDTMLQTSYVLEKGVYLFFVCTGRGNSV